MTTTSMDFTTDSKTRVHFNKKSIDEKSKKEMIRVLAEENGIIPDTDQEVENLGNYFKKLGI